ncbi:hypothetical protein TRIUR3_09964 [Triticum urartu]|uniref:KIB1-4 beta-propeller domain-containing protein n=1 Tax=Triticum urartu TaxID=4572 RepID=M8AH13_TRIUA|nr:hypothetical protein TRIUR3_09964 [Triticum urartu]
MLCFAAPIPREPNVLAAVTGCEPTLIFFFQYRAGMYHRIYDDIPAYYNLEQDGHAVCSADPTSQLCAMQFQDALCEDDGLFYLKSMITYAGHVYFLNSAATLFKIVWSGSHWYAKRIVETHLQDGCIYLVESTGKLLLVQDEPETLSVFSVDVERKVLEPIESIGSWALFLCFNKCLSVDADKLPSIEGNCIYKYSRRFRGDTMYVRYDLSNSKKECITGLKVRDPQSILIPFMKSETIHEGPLSLAQILLTAYPKVALLRDL